MNMGGEWFETIAYGKTAKDAFRKAVSEAEYMYGHAGYTGTIAEKGSFTMITLPKHYTPEVYARKLDEKCDPRIDDKWGPAGCIKYPEDIKKPTKDGEKAYLFFGWASS
jgi:hypothetical protein